MVEALPLLTLCGRFWRAVRADRLDRVLDPPASASVGRYHRPGQPALYITPEADWAVIAMGRYALADGVERVVVPLEVDRASVLDQHDDAACRALGIDREASNLDWQEALEAGGDPPSWRTADAARAFGADGLIDRSRGIAGGWHVALFRWNEPGAPHVELAGDPQPFDYDAARARWPWPRGWIHPKDRAQ